MKPVGMFVLALVVVVAGIAAYQFLVRSDDTSGGGSDQTLAGTGLVEREAMEQELGRAQAVFGLSYDEAQMKALVEKAGLALTPEQEAQVLPMLHAHLLALQQNLQDAREAALAGTPAGARNVFYARAAQEHARFQGKLRAIIDPKDADRLFRTYPSMIPPVPGAVATGKPISRDGQPKSVTITSEGQPK